MFPYFLYNHLYYSTDTCDSFALDQLVSSLLRIKNHNLFSFIRNKNSLNLSEIYLCTVIGASHNAIVIHSAWYFCQFDVFVNLMIGKERTIVDENVVKYLV